MAQRLETVTDIINLWRTLPAGRERGARVALAEDLGVAPGLVRQMALRDSIAKWHWPRLIEAAQRHAADPNASPLFATIDANLLVEVGIRPRSRRQCASASASGVQALSVCRVMQHNL